MVRSIPLLCLLGALTAAGCSDSPQAHEALKPPTVEIPTVAVTPARLQTWGQSVGVHGTLLPDESAVLGCKVAGRVAEMLVDVGDLVRKGQPIARLDEVQLQLEVKHTEALLAQACAAVGLDPAKPTSSMVPENSPVVRQERAVLDQAKLNLERAQALRRQGVTTQEELDQREADYRVAVARHAAALNAVAEKLALIEVRRSEVDLAKNAVTESTIYAPFDGLIEERSTAAGAYISAGDPVVSMVRTDKVRFLGAVPEKQSHLVRAGQQVLVHFEQYDEPISVEISRLRPQIDPTSRALMFEADIANAELILRPGAFASASVVVDPSSQSIVVPETAVTQFAGVEKVWRVVNGEAKEVAIRTGGRREGQVVVIAGLEVGDEVIVDGALGAPGKVRVDNAAPSPAQTNPALSSAE
jgi:RND family efflux transporter MFP subunit